MKNKIKPEKIIENSIGESVATKLELLKNHSNVIIETAHLMINSLQVGGKILFCGNGGSAADSQHIAAELIIRYRSSMERKALAAIALTTDPSVITAGGNDYGFDNIFARQVEGLARENDVLIGISTSGNSENVLRAMVAAKDRGIRRIGLLGGNGGKIKDHCDLKIIVPSETTARIQESHITIGHIWCEIIEEMMFTDRN